MWYLHRGSAIRGIRSRVVDSPQGLVRLGAQIQVEPAQLLVITSHDQVIPERMNVQARDPLETRHQGLDELLADEIVQADVSLGLQERSADGSQRHERDLQQRKSAACEGGMRRAGRHPLCA